MQLKKAHTHNKLAAFPHARNKRIFSIARETGMYAEYHRIFCACTKHTKPLAFLLLTAFAHNALAQWTYRVAPDPTIRSISFFINTPASGSTTLFVSTLTDGMYKVIDTGVSATSTFQKISNGLPIVQVRLHTSIDINTMYAGTDGAGLFKSIDGGANWLPLNGSVAMPLGCSNVRSFNFDVTVPRTLIVGTSCRNNSGFYKSTDDGLNWSRLGNATLPDDVGVSALNRSGNTYFLASNNYGIFKSVDAGTTWAAANTGITAPNGTLNAFNTQFNGTAPANLLTYIHGSGMYRSTDTGVTWTPSNVGLPIGLAALGGIARESSLVMYVGLDKQGVYRTIDGGVNWAAWGNTSGEVLRYSRTVATVAAGSTYYFGTLTGLAKTTDNANTHVIVGMGDSGGRINAIAHDRDTPARAYVTARDLVRIDNVYGDCSTGCSPLETGITGTTFEGVPYQDQLNPAILYVTTSNRGIFKSTDGGVSFAAINSGAGNTIVS